MNKRLYYEVIHKRVHPQSSEKTKRYLTHQEFDSRKCPHPVVKNPSPLGKGGLIEYLADQPIIIRQDIPRAFLSTMLKSFERLREQMPPLCLAWQGDE